MSESFVVAVVLLAAVLHAAWNALVKQSEKRLLTFATIIATGGALYAPVALILAPPSAASVPYIAGSVAIHLLYYAGLLYGYRYGDLGQVYPVARGTGPLVVALVSLPLAGERLAPLAIAGVVAVSLGIFTLAGRGNKRATLFALATGFTIAGYTVCDGLGVRLSESKLAYIAWLHVASGIPFAGAVMVLRRKELRVFFRGPGKRAMIGGMVAAAAYSLVIWAMSRTQLAYVASLREISVVLAALIGTWILGEPFGKRRVMAAAVIAGGILLITLGR